MSAGSPVSAYDVRPSVTVTVGAPVSRTFVPVDRADDVPGEAAVLEGALREDERLTGHVRDDHSWSRGRCDGLRIGRRREAAGRAVRERRAGEQQDHAEDEQ